MRAERALLAGDLEGSLAAYLRAAEYQSLAEIYLPEALRAALWLRDVEQLRAILVRLEAEPRALQRWSAANLTAGRAGIAALEGRTDAAIAGYADAWKRYREMEAEFLHAKSVVDAVVVLGAGSAAMRSAAASAREILVAVGARPWIDWLDAALAGQTRAPGNVRPEGAPRPTA
jgi:hypothetical protein